MFLSRTVSEIYFFISLFLYFIIFLISDTARDVISPGFINLINLD